MWLRLEDLGCPAYCRAEPWVSVFDSNLSGSPEQQDRTLWPQGQAGDSQV